MAHLVSLKRRSDPSDMYAYLHKTLVRVYNGYDIYYIGDWDEPFEYTKVAYVLKGSYTDKVVALEESFSPFNKNRNGFIEKVTDFILEQFEELTNPAIDNIFVIVRNKDKNKSLYFLLEKKPGATDETGATATSATSATSAFYKKKSMKKKSMKKKSMKKKSMKKKSLKQKKSIKKKNKKF